MAFPVASGVTTPPIYPAGSAGNGLSGTGYIPEIWSGKLIEKFYASTVLAAISNTDYEGEIKGHGDKVNIRTKPTITIHDYQSDGLLGLDRPSEPSLARHGAVPPAGVVAVGGVRARGSERLAVGHRNRVGVAALAPRDVDAAGRAVRARVGLAVDPVAGRAVVGVGAVVAHVVLRIAAVTPGSASCAAR